MRKTYVVKSFFILAKFAILTKRTKAGKEVNDEDKAAAKNAI